MALSFSCPECHTAFRTPPLAAGSAISCPACRAPLTVPDPPLAELLADPDPPVAIDVPAAEPDPIAPASLPDAPGRRGMRAGPLAGFFLVFLGLVAGGVLVVALIAKRARDLDTPAAGNPDTPTKAAGADRTAGTGRTEGGRPPPLAPPTGPPPAVAGASGLLPRGAAVVAVVVVLALVYFLPTVVALCREHVNTVGVAILNLFLGWTFYAWVLALIWSVWNHPPAGVGYRGGDREGPARRAAAGRAVLAVAGLLLAAALGVGGCLWGPLGGAGPLGGRPRDPVELHARVYGQTADEVVRAIGKPNRISQALLWDWTEYHYPQLFPGKDVVIVFERGVVSRVVVTDNTPREKERPSPGTKAGFGDGADSPGGGSAPLDPGLLAGTWERDIEWDGVPVRVTTTFRADDPGAPTGTGTWSGNVTRGGNTTVVMASGTWSLDGRRLKITCLQVAGAPADRVGRSIESEITRLTNSELVQRDPGDGSVVTSRRTGR